LALFRAAILDDRLCETFHCRRDGARLKATYRRPGGHQRISALDCGMTSKANAADAYQRCSSTCFILLFAANNRHFCAASVMPIFRMTETNRIPADSLQKPTDNSKIVQ
jgi:hypothetical protein